MRHISEQIILIRNGKGFFTHQTAVPVQCVTAKRVHRSGQAKPWKGCVTSSVHGSGSCLLRDAQLSAGAIYVVFFFCPTALATFTKKACCGSLLVDIPDLCPSLQHGRPGGAQRCPDVGQTQGELRSQHHICARPVNHFQETQRYFANHAHLAQRTFFSWLTCCCIHSYSFDSIFISHYFRPD